MASVRFALTVLAGALLWGGAARAEPPHQAAPGSALYTAIRTADAQLFGAYNRCDLKTFARMVGKNIEFYHDKGGLSLGRARLVAAIRQNICGQVTRELVPGTLTVYPMDHYGALEMGTHRFHHPGHDDTEPVGEGKFIQLWKKVGNRYVLERVISYDHHALAR